MQFMNMISLEKECHFLKRRAASFATISMESIVISMNWHFDWLLWMPDDWRKRIKCVCVFGMITIIPMNYAMSCKLAAQGTADRKGKAADRQTNAESMRIGPLTMPLSINVYLCCHISMSQIRMTRKRTQWWAFDATVCICRANVFISPFLGPDVSPRSAINCRLHDTDLHFRPHPSWN